MAGGVDVILDAVGGDFLEAGGLNMSPYEYVNIDCARRLGDEAALN